MIKTTLSVVEELFFLSDIHYPLANFALLKKLLVAIGDRYKLARAAGRRFRVVIGGDIVDFEMFGRWLKHPSRKQSLKDTLKMVRDFIAALRQAAPEADIDFKAGNHDDRLEKMLCEKMPDLVELDELQISSLFHLDKYNVKYYGSNQRFILEGGLKLTHGTKTSQAGSGYVAHGELRIAGGRSVVHGHIHHLAWVKKLGAVGVSAGFLGDPNPEKFDYLKDGDVDWMPGFVHGYRVREDSRDKKGRFQGSTSHWHLLPIEAYGPESANFILDGVLY